MRLSPPVVMASWLVLLLFVTGGLTLGALPFTPGARFSDAATSHYPAALHLRQAVVERGEFPFWRDGILIAQPFAANPLNKTAYPPQWLALLFAPTVYVQVALSAHLALAAWGMFVWAREEGLDAPAALVSAAAYSLAPRLLAHSGAGHVDVIYALAWSPFLLAAVGRAVRERTRAAVVIAAVCLALVVLGDVRVALYIVPLALAYGVWRGRESGAASGVGQTTLALPLHSQRTTLAALMFGGGVFCLLVAGLVVPLAAWSPWLTRSTMTLTDAGTFALEPVHLLGVVLPAHGGNPETVTAVGLPAGLLALVAIAAAPRRHLFWLAAMIAAALYALGGWAVVAALVPPLQQFRVPARAWFVVALVVPLLAGYGVQALGSLHTRPPDVRRRFIVLALAGLASASACAVFTLAALPLPPGVVLSVVFGAMAALAAAVAVAGGVKLRTAYTVLLVLVCVDGWWTGTRWLEWRSEARWLAPYLPLVERLHALDAVRVYSPSYSLPQEAAASAGLRLFGGVDPFQIRGLVAIIAQGSGVTSEGYSVVQPPLVGAVGDDVSSANRDAVPNTRLLGGWDVSHVVAAYPLAHPRLEAMGEVNGVTIYANRDFTGRVTNAYGWQPRVSDAPSLFELNRLMLITAAAYALSALAWLGVGAWALNRLRTQRRFGVQ